MRTVAEVISALGGHKEVATWAGVGVTAVHNWLAFDEIPRHHSLALYLKLRAQGYEVDTIALFGVDEAGNYVPVEAPVIA